jgi:hypothetical protein
LIGAAAVTTARVAFFHRDRLTEPEMPADQV